MQRQMRRLANPFPDEGAMRFKHRLTVAAYLARRYRAGLAMTLRPLHHGRHRNAKPRCDRTTALTLRNRRNNTLTQVIGNWSNHRMLASSPSQHLESHSPQIRNPSRFN
jgi:hypothetical protein